MTLRIEPKVKAKLAKQAKKADRSLSNHLRRILRAAAGLKAEVLA